MNVSVSKLLVLLVAVIAMAAPAYPSENGSGMTVLVVGASGRTGRLAATQLVRVGVDVRAMTRDVERAREKAGTRLNWIVGDVSKPETLVEPLRGVSHVVAAMASSYKDPTNNPESVDYRGVVNLVDAAKAAGVRRIVLLSSMGVTRTDSVELKSMLDLLRYKLKGEDYLRDSGMGYTIIRPGGLRDEPGRQKALVLTQGDRAPFAAVARADVARVAVECLTNTAASNKTFEVTGETDGDSDAWLETLRNLSADTD